MSYYQRGYRRRSLPSFYGSRYYSTRPTPGLYRTASRYMLTGKARRVFRSKRYFQRIVKSMAEHKMTQTPYIYGPTQANQITSVGVLTNVTDINQGVQSDERIGDKITTCSLGLHITCNPSNSATIQNTLYNRLLIFIWKDDSTPVLTDVFEDITKPWISFLRYDNKVKRKILYDKMWVQWVEGNAPTSVMVPAKIINVNLNLSKIKRRLNVVNYQPASANATNHLYFILINNSTVAGNTWDYQIIERITWIDM